MTPKINILVIDDDPICHLISMKFIQQTGLTNEIYTACNGKLALDLIHTFSCSKQSIPHVIFVDLNMPILDGFGFIEAFKELSIPGKDKIQIAIVTSSIDSNDRNHANELGIDHFLTKPLSEQTVRSVLEAINGTEIV